MPSDTAPATRGSCGAASSGQAVAVSLPIVGETKPEGIRPSRSGRRRAIVLFIVQGLMIAHVVFWLLSRRYGWFGGITTTPIEPSESMEFVKHGAINAGLIFFAVALLSTLVLGRWFCGWGCHLVLLQDGCGWLMKKFGIRPKPFRSRLLIWVPLLLALYMFVWPAVYRGAMWIAAKQGWVEQSLPAWQVSWHVTTDEFWKTFPGLMVAIPFLLICGFATVYFLGAKGFCTYGCPYGGFFAPLDRLAPARIRVTDACEGCGHCTAVCTSNVRVHEEVREYGMVVDPGCMKCLDCVSVCPNDALYFGFGKPAVAKGPARNAEPKRRYDLGWPEEIGLALVFAASFFAVRGVYGIVPMLMAAGVAGCITYLAWKLWRLLRDQNVNLHRYRLRFRGAFSRSGIVFASIAALVLLLTVHSGVVRAAAGLAGRYDDRITIGRDAVFSGSGSAAPAAQRDDAARALRFYRAASGFNAGGIGFPAPWQAELDMRIAWLHAVRSEFSEAEAVLRGAIERDGPSDRFCANLAWVLRGSGERGEALTYYRDVLLEEPEFHQMLEDFARWSPSVGAIDAAIALCRERLRRFDDRASMRWLSLLELESGDIQEGVALLRRRVEVDSRDEEAHRTLAMALAQAGQIDEALRALDGAIALVPDDAHLRFLQANLLSSLGRLEPARQALLVATDLAPHNPQLRFDMAQLLEAMGRSEEAARWRREGERLAAPGRG